MIIFTLHVLERMKQRGISIEEIKSIDEIKFIKNSNNATETSQYIKYLKNSAIKIIYRFDIDGNILIITCFRINK